MALAWCCATIDGQRSDITRYAFTAQCISLDKSFDGWLLVAPEIDWICSFFFRLLRDDDDLCVINGHSINLSWSLQKDDDHQRSAWGSRRIQPVWWMTSTPAWMSRKSSTLQKAKSWTVCSTSLALLTNYRRRTRSSSTARHLSVTALGTEYSAGRRRSPEPLPFYPASTSSTASNTTPAVSADRKQHPHVPLIAIPK